MYFWEILSALYALVMLGLAYYTFKLPQSRLRLYLKMTCSSLFVMIAIYWLWYGTNKAWAIGILIAQIVALIGDYYLGKKEESLPGYLLKGVGAFTICQFIYWMTFSQVKQLPLYVIIGAGAFVMGLYFIKLPFDLGKEKGVLCLYGLMLILMVLSAMNIYIGVSQEAFGNVLFMAALSFGISDIILLFKYFIIKNNRYIMVFNVFTYFIAQWLFAMSSYWL